MVRKPRPGLSDTASRLLVVTGRVHGSRNLGPILLFIFVCSVMHICKIFLTATFVNEGISYKLFTLVPFRLLHCFLSVQPCIRSEFAWQRILFWSCGMHEQTCPRKEMQIFSIVQGKRSLPLISYVAKPPSCCRTCRRLVWPLVICPAPSDND